MPRARTAGKPPGMARMRGLHRRPDPLSLHRVHESQCISATPHRLAPEPASILGLVGTRRSKRLSQMTKHRPVWPAMMRGYAYVQIPGFCSGHATREILRVI